MTQRGRRWRLGASLGLVAALVVGTAWGDDDHFPFGPFRMYASTVDLDAPTSWLALEVVSAGGERVAMPEGIGLRRAELEARAATFIADPTQLAPLLEAYAADHPEQAARAVELVRWQQAMDGGRPDGDVRAEVLATWPP